MRIPFFSKIYENCTDGNLPPRPSLWKWNMGSKFSRLVRFLEVGEIKLTGKTVYLLQKNPKIIAINHSSPLDVFIMPYLGHRPRVMASEKVLKFHWIIGWFLTEYMGCYAASTSKAIDASIKLLEAGESICIAPEGWTTVTGELKKFKTGTVRIAQQAKVPIIPVSIKYNRYPGKWILIFPDLIQWIIIWVFFLNRGNSTINVGSPITELPEDIYEATEILKNRIKQLM